jgi:RimJ/RimL family protein N-acetyltransferase
MSHPYWPLFDLVVRTPRLELRYPDDALLTEMAKLASQGIHDPAVMPFSHPWTDAPSPQLERNTLQHFWKVRAETTPANWGINFAVLIDGVVVGSQGMTAKDFAITRTFMTGSWLGQSHQGQGIGKEMRAAILHFGFAGLGAQRADSGAFADNPASIAVSRALGYADDGSEIVARRGSAARLLHYWMPRATWEQQRRDDVEILGLDPCLDLLGLTAAP